MQTMQERTQYKPTTDSALMKWIVRHAAWLIPLFKAAMCSPRSIVQWVDRIVESCWSLAKPCSHAHLPEVGKGSGNPAPLLADRWKSAVWLGSSDLTDEHLVRTDDGVVYARSVRRLAEHSWSEENLRPVVETPQKPRSTATDDSAGLRALPKVHDHDNANEEKNEDDNEDEKPPDKPEDDQDMQGEMLPEPDNTTSTPRTSSSSRRELHRNTRECVCEEKSEEEVAEAADHTCPTS